MKKCFQIAFLIIVLLTKEQSANAQTETDTSTQWKDLKYSMFIHWGIYSVLGGVWEGKPISKGLSEQIQAHAGIYSDTYAAVAKSFNPVNWNADSIVMLAKNAGMRSIVITSKHHDGFCMFKTATTDFNVVDATPFRRDVIKEMSKACRKYGLRFGVYFSLIDWHYPQASPISSHNSDYITPEHYEYNKKQVTELLTQYGTISELWFDMGSQSRQQSKELRELVHRLQPDCKIGSRIGNDMGDFTVMGDNQQPDYVIGVLWQSPASFFDETWGYRSWQKRGNKEEKFREKLTSLIKVVSRGGNYLLNIGPKGDGSVVEFEKDILLKIGAWLQKNGEAIYGTHADPFQTLFSWGSVTSKPGKLYLHLLTYPQNGIINLPGLNGKISKVYLLEDKTITADFKTDAQAVKITVPKTIDSNNAFKVVVVEFEKGYSVSPAHIINETGNKIILKSNNAFKYYSSSGIDYNSNYRSTIKEAWSVRPRHSGSFIPYIYYSNEEKGKAIALELNNKQDTLILENDEELPLKNDTALLKWGPLYLSGPHWSGIEGVNDDATNIDITKPWSHKPWVKTDYQFSKVYTLPADMTNAYYVLQEINSDVKQSVLISITSGDGILAILNGKELLVHNNPQKKISMKDLLLLHLQKGRNRLLIKLFNNYQKAIVFSIDNNVPQIMYRKNLENIYLKKENIYSFSWKLYNPETEHQTLRLPNLSLEMIKQ